MRPTLFFVSRRYWRSTYCSTHIGESRRPLKISVSTEYSHKHLQRKIRKGFNQDFLNKTSNCRPPINTELSKDGLKLFNIFTSGLNGSGMTQLGTKMDSTVTKYGMCCSEISNNNRWDNTLKFCKVVTNNFWHRTVHQWKIRNDFFFKNSYTPILRPQQIRGVLVPEVG